MSSTENEAELATHPQRWKRLLKSLKALPETVMRREVLAERLGRCSPEEVYDFLKFLCLGVAQRRSVSLDVLEAVNAWVLSGQEQGPTYELLAEVYGMARQDNAEAVSRLLMMARPQRGPAGPEQAPGDLELSRLTLGERKFMARGHDRFRLDRLLADPDPSVLHNLLRNPMLTEQDVVRLAAKRPVVAEVLRKVFDSRWGIRYTVRLALAYNPYTPTDLGLKLVAFLLLKDLKQVAADGNLHPLLREEARRLAAQRRAKKTESSSGSKTPGSD